MLCRHDWTGDDECAYCRNEELEKQLAEKDEYHEAYKEEYLDTLKELCELCTEKDAEIRMWKERVIEWQDVDSSNQDEIERLRDIAYPPGY